MAFRLDGRGSTSPNKAKRPLTTKTVATASGADVKAAIAPSGASAALEPGTLKLYISHGEDLKKFVPNEPAGVWKLEALIDVLGYQHYIDQAPVPPPPRAKAGSKAKEPADSSSPRPVSFDKALAVPVHWSPSQSRVPVLQLQLYHSSDPDVPVAFASLDLPAIILRPLQLLRLQLPLLTATDTASTADLAPTAPPTLHVRVLYCSQSSPAGHVASLSDRLLLSNSQAAAAAQGPAPVGTPAGKLQVQLYSVTKLKRGCTEVASPRVSVSVQLPGEARQAVQVCGSPSPFGEYAIYFDRGAEALLTLPHACATHPVVDLVLESSGGGPMEEGGGGGDEGAAEMGRVSVPVLDAMSKEGHILDVCYPLRAPGSCLKVADLRLSLQYVPDDLVYVQRPPAAQDGQAGQGTRVLRLRIGAMRGLYCPDLPGRRDPYVEVGLLMPPREGGAAEEEEEEAGSRASTEGEGGEALVSVVRSSISVLGFENVVWDEVVEVPVGLEHEAEPLALAVRVKSAAVLSSSHRLLGRLRLPWPGEEGGESGWYQLQHPTDPGGTVGELSLAFLGVVDGACSRLQPVLDDPAAALTSFYSAVALSPSKAIGGLASPTGFTREAWAEPAPQPAELAHRGAGGGGGARLLPATRCSQLEPCGPGFLMCTVTCLQTIAMHGPLATVETFRASSVYVKVKQKPDPALQQGGGTVAMEEDTYQDLDNDSTLSASRNDVLSFQPAPAGGKTSSKPAKARLYPPLIGEHGDATAPAPVDTLHGSTHRQRVLVLVAPITQGRQSQVRLYFGKGRDPSHRKWYRGTIDPSTAMALPGRQLQLWRLLTPITRFHDVPATDLGPPSPGVRDPQAHEAGKLGRVHLHLRYVPHSRGTVSVRLGQASLRVGPEAALSSDPSVSYVFHRLFVRARLMPGGDWAMSSAKDTALPVSRGQAEQSLSWGDEELCLGLDTTTLPLLKTSGTPVGPCLELAVLNDQPVLENCRALAFYPLADLLSLPPSSSSDGPRAAPPVSLPLLHPLTAQPVGTLSARLAFHHLYTPAAALAKEDQLAAAGEGGGGEGGVQVVAGAIRDLKRLFYTLDRSGDGQVSQDELLGYLTRPVAGRQQQDLTDLMTAVLKGRPGGSSASAELLDVSETVREVFRSIDVNGDGQVSWEEWVSFLDMLRLSRDGSALLDVGLLRRNAEAMKAAQQQQQQTRQPLPGSRQDPGPLPPPVALTVVKRPPVVKDAAATAPPSALPLMLHTTALLDLNTLTTPVSSSIKPAAAPPSVRSVAGGKQRSVAGKASGGAGGRGRGVEELQEENARLRRRVQALEEEKRAKEVELRKGLEAERSRFKKEVGYLVEAARDTVAHKQQQQQYGSIRATGGTAGWGSPGGFPVDGEGPQTAGGGQGGAEEEALHLRALVQALKGANEELRSALESAKGELAGSQVQADVLRAELSGLSRQRLNDDTVKLELRRLDAARRTSEESRSMEVRGLVGELTMARQELRACSRELALQQEAAERARTEVEQLRQLLETEHRQTEQYKGLVQRYRSALSVHEHDKMRARALQQLKEESMAQALGRQRLQHAESLAELQAQHKAAEKLQAGIRGFVVRQQNGRQRRAVITIQSCVRALLATRRVRRLKTQMEQSAQKIQSLYRGFTAHKEAQLRRKSVVTIQAGFRGQAERRRNSDWMAQATKERHDKAVAIQAAYRAAKHKHAYAGLKRAVQVIKAKLKKYALRKERLRRRGAARRIARVMGRWLAERHRSAAVVQRAYRRQRSAATPAGQQIASTRPAVAAAAPPAVAKAAAPSKSPTASVAPTKPLPAVAVQASAPPSHPAMTASLSATSVGPSDDDDEALFDVPELEHELAIERTSKLLHATATTTKPGGLLTQPLPSKQAVDASIEDNEASLYAIDSARTSPRSRAPSQPAALSIAAPAPAPAKPSGAVTGTAATSAGPPARTPPDSLHAGSVSKAALSSAVASESSLFDIASLDEQSPRSTGSSRPATSAATAQQGRAASAKPLAGAASSSDNDLFNIEGAGKAQAAGRRSSARMSTDSIFDIGDSPRASAPATPSVASLASASHEQTRTPGASAVAAKAQQHGPLVQPAEASATKAQLAPPAQLQEASLAQPQPATLAQQPQAAAPAHPQPKSPTPQPNAAAPEQPQAAAPTQPHEAPPPTQPQAPPPAQPQAATPASVPVAAPPAKVEALPSEPAPSGTEAPAVGVKEAEQLAALAGGDEALLPPDHGPPHDHHQPATAEGQGHAKGKPSMEGRPEHGERPAQGKGGGQGEGQEATQPRPTAAAIAAQAASASPEEEPSKLPPASPASGSGQATDGPAPPVETEDKRPSQEDLTAAATPAPSVQPEQQKPPSTAHPPATSPSSSADLEARDHSPALHESPTTVVAVPPAGPHATPTLVSEQAGGTKGKESTGGAPPASQPQPPPASAADSSATGASTSLPVTPSGVGEAAKEGEGQVPPQSSSTLPAPAVQPGAAPVLAASASTASTDKPLTAMQQTTSSATDLYSTAAGELYTTAVAGSTDSLARTDSSPAAATATAGLGGEKEDSSSVEEAALAALVGRQVLVPVDDEDGGGERLPARVVGYDTATRRLRVVYDDDPDVQDDVDVRSVIVTNRPSTAQGEGDGHGMAPAGSAPPVVQALPPQHGQQKQQETATEPTKGYKAGPGDAAALQAREARLSALVGRAVSVRLPADEDEGGEEEELLPAQIVGYDAARNTVRVRYDDDPDTAEDMPVDSPDLVIADTTQAPTINNKPTGPAAPLVEKPQAASPPEGEACIGWTVRVDLGDGMSELGQVVGYNKASGALVVSFPTLDAEEECNRAELTFLAKY